MRSLRLGAVWVGLALSLSGCHHQVSTWVPPQMQPVALLDVPEDETTELSAPPVEDLPEVPVASAAESMKSPVRRRPRAPAVTVTPSSAVTPGGGVEQAPDVEETV